MARKIFMGIFIIIASVALFFVGSLVVLFLAPGVEIFGVRYVAPGVSDFGQSVKLESFDGNIYLTTSDVPINIHYTQYYSSEISFKQKFIGFTRSENKTAGLEVSYSEFDGKKNLIIKTEELKKWLYAQESEEYFSCDLYLPVAYNSERNIYVKSNTSSLNVVGSAVCSSLEFESEGAFKVVNTLSVSQKLKCYTTQSIDLHEGVTALNCDLKSTRGAITIANAVAGELVAETRGGDIKFVSCKALSATTESGAVRGVGEGLPSVSGSVTINTRGGAVNLGAVGTSGAEVDITSTSGSVDIAELINGKIQNERGRVFVGKATNLEIVDNIGNITVGQALGSLIVEGRNGKVELGSSGVIMNPTVRTTTGAIKLINAAGTVDVKSVSNSVDFANKSSANITLHAGKNLTAKELFGVVKIYTNGNADIKFKEITANVSIETGSKSDSVVVDATCCSFSSVDYHIESTKGTRAEVYAGTEMLKNGAKITSGDNGKRLIKAISSYAKIVLKLAV